MMSTYKCKGRNSSAGLTVLTALTLSGFSAKAADVPRTCASPPAETLEAVRRYAARVNYVDLSDGIRIASIIPANEECFWRVEIEGIGQERKSASFFLSSNFRHVAPLLFDLERDPLEEESRRQKAIAAALSAGRPPQKGDRSAVPVVVEFSDFQCPFCKRQSEILESATSRPDAAFRLEFRHFPLSTHPWAEEAAEVAACALSVRSELFWITHNALFAHQNELLPRHVLLQIRGYLSSNVSTTDLNKLSNCVDNHEQASTVRSDEALGRALGVDATPTLFVNGMMLKGIRTAEQLNDAIRKSVVLAKQAVSSAGDNGR